MSGAPPNGVSITAGELAARIGATLVGDADVRIDRVEALDLGREGSVTFVRSERFADDWAVSRASAAIVSTPVVQHLRQPGAGERRALLVVPDADLALIGVLEHFAPRPSGATPGIHPSASVDASAKVAPGASIGPNCTLCAGASVGEGAVLVGNVYVGPRASVGAGSVLQPGVRLLERCRVGAACILHPGATIGADGFGFRPAPDGNGLVKIPHIGDVVIEDGVEIGANACIDRAKFGSTVIGAGTKIDNLVQIGHNCRIGRCVVICGNTGVSGSVRIGDGAVLGGGVGVADNVEIGERAQIAAFSGVMHNVPPGEVWMGLPAAPAREYRRNVVAFKSLAKLMPKIKRLLGEEV